MIDKNAILFEIHSSGDIKRITDAKNARYLVVGVTMKVVVPGSSQLDDKPTLEINFFNTDGIKIHQIKESFDPEKDTARVKDRLRDELRNLSYAHLGGKYLVM